VYKARVVNGFRDEMKPVARRIAAEKGLGVVVTKNETVLFTYDDAVDVTDEVAAELLSRRGSTPPEESPPPPSRTARKPN
jgi:Skp family chaperone for outer membrane proteins